MAEHGIHAEPLGHETDRHFGTSEGYYLVDTEQVENLVLRGLHRQANAEVAAGLDGPAVQLQNMLTENASRMGDDYSRLAHALENGEDNDVPLERHEKIAFDGLRYLIGRLDTELGKQYTAERIKAAPVAFRFMSAPSSQAEYADGMLMAARVLVGRDFDPDPAQAEDFLDIFGRGKQLTPAWQISEPLRLSPIRKGHRRAADEAEVERANEHLRRVEGFQSDELHTWASDKSTLLEDANLASEVPVSVGIATHTPRLIGRKEGPRTELYLSIGQ